MPEKINFLRKTPQISRIVLSSPRLQGRPIRITFCSSEHLQPAVNRQPGYRRGDREVVGRDYIIFFIKKKSIFSSHKYY